MGFFSPANLTKGFNLDLSKKRQAEWDSLMADLPSVQALRITSDFGHGLPHEQYVQRYKERMVLHYISSAAHPRLPEYAARLGHVSLSLLASPSSELALVSQMQALATEGRIGQA